MPASFDPERWSQIAARRFHKACDASRKGAAAQFLRDQRSIPGLIKLVDWASSSGLKVSFSRIRNGAYDSSLRELRCSDRMCAENQLFVLLHESGHFDVGNPGPLDRFGSGYAAVSNPAIKHSMLHRIDVLDEELTAWALGLQRAKDLQIDIDIMRYNRLKASYVKSYISWALGTGDYVFDEGKDA